jgi:hypothetical protein
VASQDLAPGDVVLNLPPIAAGVRNEKYIKARLFAESYGCKYIRKYWMWHVFWHKIVIEMLIRMVKDCVIYCTVLYL